MTSVFGRITLLPVGSREYHGERLPADTDTIIAEHIARAVAASLPDATRIRVLPSVQYGVSTEHLGLPDTVSVSPPSYFSFMRELCFTAAAGGRELIVAINGHGGNTNSLATLEAEFNYAHRDSKLYCPPIYPSAVKSQCKDLFGEFDAHAGSVESSLLAHILGWNYDSYEVDLGKEMRGSLRFFPTRDLNPLGVIKRLPTVLVDPAAGKLVAELMVQCMVDDIIDIDNRLSQVIGIDLP